MEPPSRSLTREEALALYTVNVKIEDPEDPGYSTSAQTSALNAVPSTISNSAPTPNLQQHHTPHLTDGFAPSPTPSMLQDLALRSSAPAIASSLPSTLSLPTSNEIPGSRSESTAQNQVEPAHPVYPSSVYSLFGITPNLAQSDSSSERSASLSADKFAPLPTSNENRNLGSRSDSRVSIDSMLGVTQNLSVPSQTVSMHQIDALSSIDRVEPISTRSIPPPDFSLLDLSIAMQPGRLQTPPPLSSHQFAATHSTDAFAALPAADTAQNSESRHFNPSNNEAAVLLEALFAKCIPSQATTGSSEMLPSGQLNRARENQHSPPQPRQFIQPGTSSTLPTTSGSSGGFPPFQSYDEFLKSQQKGSTLDSGTPTPPQPILPPPTAGSSQVYSSRHSERSHTSSDFIQSQPNLKAGTTGRPSNDHISHTEHCRHPQVNQVWTPPAQPPAPIQKSGRDSTPPPPLEDQEKQHFATQSMLFIPPFRPADPPQFGAPPDLKPKLDMKSMNPNIHQHQPVAPGNHFSPFPNKPLAHQHSWANQPYPWAGKCPDMPMYPHPCHVPDVSPPQQKKAPIVNQAPPKPKKYERVTQYEHRNLKEHHEMLTMYHRKLIGEHSELQKKYESVEKEKDCAQELVTTTQRELLAANEQNNHYKSCIDSLFRTVDSCAKQVDKVSQEIKNESRQRGEQQRKISDLEGEIRNMRSSIDEFNEAKTDFIEVLKANKLDCDTFMEDTQKKTAKEFTGALQEALDTLKHFNYHENEESKRRIVEQEQSLKAVDEKWSKKFLETQERLDRLEDFKVKAELKRELHTKCQSWLKIQRENGSFPSEEQSDSSPSYLGAQSEEPTDFPVDVEEARRKRKKERKEMKMDASKKEKRRKSGINQIIHVRKMYQNA
ncbi:hypothetical protein CAEBREN_02443 [Caenorhabditis brenneri]|uniref:Uncharacterized protein n=1 Tax=Caenorhabditis brenneri TaxID=135651 RepID=G0P4H4_CAEBE|nr:hypothetical protein CAEBREN_02443 [Caenorhabditis brenneri]